MAGITPFQFISVLFFAKQRASHGLVLAKLGVSIRVEHLQSYRGFTTGENFSDEQATDGRHRDPQHGVATSRRQVSITIKAAHIRPAARGG